MRAFHSFQEQELRLELGEIIAKTWQKQQEDNSEGDIFYLENIWGAGQTQTYRMEDELNTYGSIAGFQCHAIQNRSK